MQVTIVDALPRGATTRGKYKAVVRAAIDAAPKYVRVTAETDGELTRIYKSLLQYRNRHPTPHFNVRKYEGAIYVFVAS